MPDFSYKASTLTNVSERMQDEAGYGRSGANFTHDYVASIPASAGSAIFSDAVSAIRGTGNVLADLHAALDKYWTHSSNEVAQTLEMYESTDDRAAADADALYKDHVKNPVPEEKRL
ncbi:MAG: hypothetical protein ACTH2Q_05045 [Propionibacteriaceae bacterium]